MNGVRHQRRFMTSSEGPTSCWFTHVLCWIMLTSVQHTCIQHTHTCTHPCMHTLHASTQAHTHKHTHTHTREGHWSAFQERESEILLYSKKAMSPHAAHRSTQGRYACSKARALINPPAPHSPNHMIVRRHTYI